MCELAVAGVSGFEVDDRELHREGPTYTVDTLRTFPDEEELFLILGADAAEGIRSWHRWESVLARADVVIAPRPGAAIPDIPGAVLVDTGLLEISGTGIRSAVRSDSPWRFLVPGVVHDYIRTHDLYTNPHGDDIVEGSENMESSS